VNEYRAELSQANETQLRRDYSLCQLSSCLTRTSWERCFVTPFDSASTSVTQRQDYHCTALHCGRTQSQPRPCARPLSCHQPTGTALTRDDSDKCRRYLAHDARLTATVDH